MEIEHLAQLIDLPCVVRNIEVAKFTEMKADSLKPVCVAFFIGFASVYCFLKENFINFF